MSSFTEKFKLLYEKIKKIKHFYVYLAIGIAGIIVLIYLSTMPSVKNEDKQEIDNNLTEFTSSAEYTQYLENKLESVISALNGVGNAEVAITLEKGFEYVYQTEDEVRTNANGTSISSSKLVYIDGKPVLLEEIYPIVKGVVVIADTSNGVATKLDIINVIQTMVDIDATRINVMI